MTFEGHSLNFWGYVFGSGRGSCYEIISFPFFILFFFNWCRSRSKLWHHPHILASCILDIVWHLLHFHQLFLTASSLSDKLSVELLQYIWRLRRERKLTSSKYFSEHTIVTNNFFLLSSHQLFPLSDERWFVTINLTFAKSKETSLPFSTKKRYKK
jgi:hypothetical protein